MYNTVSNLNYIISIPHMKQSPGSISLDSNEQPTNNVYLRFMEENLNHVLPRIVKSFKKLYESDSDTALERLKKYFIYRLEPQQFFVLKEYYGLFESAGTTKTFETIGGNMQITPNRGRQIRDIALRKISHPELWGIVTDGKVVDDKEDGSEGFRKREISELPQYKQTLIALSESLSYSKEFRSVLYTLGISSDPDYQLTRIYSLTSRQKLASMSRLQRSQVLLLRTYWPAPETVSYLDHPDQHLKELLDKLGKEEQQSLRQYYGLDQGVYEGTERSKAVTDTGNKLREIAQGINVKKQEESLTIHQMKIRQEIQRILKRLGNKFRGLTKDISAMKALRNKEGILDEGTRKQLEEIQREIEQILHNN